MVCAGQDLKNDLEITARGGEEGGRYGMSTVGEGEEGSGVVRAVDMGTRLALKIHDRGEGAVKSGRNGFIPKVVIGGAHDGLSSEVRGGKKY